MSNGISVREARALSIGIAAAHRRWRMLGYGFDDGTCCGPCGTWGRAVADAYSKAPVGVALPSALALASAVLLDELRREADEQAAREARCQRADG